MIRNRHVFRVAVMRLSILKVFMMAGSIFSKITNLLIYSRKFNLSDLSKFNIGIFSEVLYTDMV